VVRGGETKGHEKPSQKRERVCTRLTISIGKWELSNWDDDDDYDKKKTENGEGGRQSETTRTEIELSQVGSH
jgi:hypothetical protein